MERFNISERGTAAICSALLMDLGVINLEHSEAIIDRNKIRREKENLHESLELQRVIDNEKYVSDTPVYTLFFDGKSNKTNIPMPIAEEVNRTHRYSSKNREYISMLLEPGSRFLAYTTTEDKTSIAICNKMMDKIKSEQISLDRIFGLGSDGTNVNTDNNNGK